jgi:hypothetical protein
MGHLDYNINRGRGKELRIAQKLPHGIEFLAAII